MSLARDLRDTPDFRAIVDLGGSVNRRVKILSKIS